MNYMGWFEVVFDPAGIKQDMKDGKKAAQQQAAAIREQTAATVRQAGLAAEAAANQIRNTQATEQAAEYARSILGRPTETVNVRLAPQASANGSVAQRQAGPREAYVSPWFR